MNEVEAALFSTLSAATALTSLLGGTAIFNGLAPQGQGYPFVTFAQMAHTDDNETMHRAKQLLYLVQGWSQRDMTEAGSIDAACDAALHGKHVTVTGWTNFWTARESSVRLSEVGRDSREAFRSGGVYRVRIAQ